MKMFLLLFYTLFLISCEKNIRFDLKAVPDLLVVDASIENGQPPVVVLSKSFDYYSDINPQL
ncbi:MAG: DUF4249 domain-containing protein, partial [Ginsengibacter sp.]